MLTWQYAHSVCVVLNNRAKLIHALHALLEEEMRSCPSGDDCLESETGSASGDDSNRFQHPLRFLPEEDRNKNIRGAFVDISFPRLFGH